MRFETGPVTVFHKRTRVKLQEKRLNRQSEYSLNMHRALALTLLFLNLLVLVTPKVKLQLMEGEGFSIIIHAEDIPRTRQAYLKPPPVKPTVPVPTEDPAIPEDITIKLTDLDLKNIAELVNSDLGVKQTQIRPPRPLVRRVPECHDADGAIELSIQIDARGKVIDVVVLKNETGSERCAQGAVEAAFASSFAPARENGKPVPSWVSQAYQFRNEH